jgi:hypothetical protein
VPKNPISRSENPALAELVRRLTLRKSGGGKQLVRRFVQVLIRAERGRQMSNQLSGKLVNVDAPEIVKFFAPRTENRRATDDRYVDALAIEDISVHRKASYSVFSLPSDAPDFQARLLSALYPPRPPGQ